MQGRDFTSRFKKASLLHDFSLKFPFLVVSMFLVFLL